MNAVVGRSITSKENPRLKRWQQLLESRGIHKTQQCLFFGERIVREILQSQPDHCRELIYPRSWPHRLPAPTTVSHYILDGQLFKTLDVFGTRAPLLRCKIPAIQQWNPEEAPQGLEVVCPLGDPSNVGALLRTCQAFGVRKVILLKEAASPFHPKSIRAASGAVFNVECVHGPSIQDLIHHHVASTMVALDVSGDDVSEFPWPKSVRILIGEEGQGLQASSFSQKVGIPMMKGMHSLNAVVAASIAMYAYRLRHPL